MMEKSHPSELEIQMNWLQNHFGIFEEFIWLY